MQMQIQAQTGDQEITNENEKQIQIQDNCNKRSPINKGSNTISANPPQNSLKVCDTLGYDLC